MRLFKKSSQKENDNGANQQAPEIQPEMKSKSSIFSWFKKLINVAEKAATVENVEEKPCEKNIALAEIEFVPKTEITASRQALSNIQLTLYGETSGTSSGIAPRAIDDEVGKNTINRGCENKFCCGVFLRSHSTPSDEQEEDDDDSIKSFNHEHFTLNKNQSQSELNKQETISRRIKSNNLRDDDYYGDKDFYICYEPAIDYGRLEVPDSIYPSVMDWPSIKYGNFLDVSKPKKIKKNKPTQIYDVLSSIEHNLDPSKYNLWECVVFNCQYHHIHENLGSGCRPQWKVDDYKDNGLNIPMSDDTRTIKEFYRINELGDILLHYHDIFMDDVSHSIGRVKKGFFGLLSWMVFKGKEIKEHHKIKEKRSWLSYFPLRSLNDSEYISLLAGNNLQWRL